MSPFAWARMMSPRWFFVGLFLVTKGLLFSAPEVVKRAAPEWVSVAALDEAGVARSVADGRERDIDYLLLDRQVDVREQTDTTRATIRVVSEGGLQEAGRWSVSFDPEYQEVWYHRLDVRRDGVVQDRLAAAEFRYLEQESAEAMHLYDGQVTALTLLEDLRVGDVVDVSYSVRGRNPVFAGYYFDGFSLGWGQALGRLHVRVTAPETKVLRYKLFGDSAPAPEFALAGDERVVEWNVDRVPAVVFEEGTPSWYPVYPWAQFSEFASWAEVVAWALPLYQAGHDAPDATLRAEVDAVLAPLGAGAMPSEVAAALLAWVQREIRYLGIELGVSSHRPHPPVETYTRRFGDCKDKALLLVQLLRDRGIPASPVLVNSAAGEALRDRLPSPGVFDHVIVGIEIDGALWWVDPTMSPQEGTLAQRAAPDYGWGLLISQGEAELRRVDQAEEATRRIDVVEALTSRGFEEPGELEVTTRYYGAAAVSIRAYFNGSSPEQISQSYQDYYANLYPEIRIEGPPILRDIGSGAIEVRETYVVPSLWRRVSNDTIWRLETYPLTLDTYLPYGMAANRRTPRSIDHPIRVSVRQELHLHESWGLDLPPLVIDHEGFSYRRDSRGDGTRLLLVEHDYVSNATHVPAGGMSAYVQAVNAARDGLGVELTWNGAVGGAVADDGAFAPNLLMFVIALGGAVGAAGLTFWWVRHRHRQPPPLVAEGAQPQGLGGWLVLPALALIVSPFRLLHAIFTDFAVAFDHDLWIALTTPGAETANLGLAVLILCEVLANVVSVVVSIAALVLFFRRDRAFPTLMRFFLIYSFGVILGDTIALEGFEMLSEEAEKAETYRGVVRQLVGMAIWVPYFSVSKRVRNTFTR